MIIFYGKLIKIEKKSIFPEQIKKFDPKSKVREDEIIFK